MSTEAEALEWYISRKPVGAKTEIVSSFWAALRDARGTTGRDQNTGHVVRAGETGCWLGAVGYLSFLDQVGTAVTVRRPGPKRAERISLINCLRDFDRLGTSARDQEAVYALRCCLAHDFSLFNFGKGPRAASLTFQFGLLADPHEPLIRHSPRRWKGQFSVSSSSTRTWVNLRALGELAEGCARGVVEAFRQGKLASRLSPDDLVKRYTFSFGNE